MHLARPQQVLQLGQSPHLQTTSIQMQLAKVSCGCHRISSVWRRGLLVVESLETPCRQALAVRAALELRLGTPLGVAWPGAADQAQCLHPLPPFAHHPGPHQ